MQIYKDLLLIVKSMSIVDPYISMFGLSYLILIIYLNLTLLRLRYIR